MAWCWNLIIARLNPTCKDPVSTVITFPDDCSLSADTVSTSTFPSVVQLQENELSESAAAMQKQPHTSSDTSSVDSAISALDEMTPSAKRVFQAYLVHYGRNDGPVLSRSPSNRKLIKSIPLRNHDSL